MTGPNPSRVPGTITRHTHPSPVIFILTLILFRLPLPRPHRHPSPSSITFLPNFRHPHLIIPVIPHPYQSRHPHPLSLTLTPYLSPSPLTNALTSTLLKHLGIWAGWPHIPSEYFIARPYDLSSRVAIPIKIILVRFNTAECIWQCTMHIPAGCNTVMQLYK